MYKIRDSLREQYLKKEKSDFKFLLAIAIIVLIMSVIIFLNTYVFFNVIVEGPSMQPTLYTADVLVANKNREVKRGDIIVIDGVKRNGDGYVWLIKRAIAFEGQTVEIKNGKVYVDNVCLEEDYLSFGTETKAIEWSKKTLGKNEVFYLGDNRAVSADSRTYGTCTLDNIVGVVEEWSLDIRWLNKIFYDFGRIFRGA